MAAEKGLSSAEYNLGVMYLRGQGVKQDFLEARKWFIRSADQNYAYAWNDLAYMYEKGVGVPRDFSIAMDYYQKASDLGCRMAAGNLMFLRMALKTGRYDTYSPPFPY